MVRLRTKIFNYRQSSVVESVGLVRVAPLQAEGGMYLVPSIFIHSSEVGHFRYLIFGERDRICYRIQSLFTGRQGCNDFLLV